MAHPLGGGADRDVNRSNAAKWAAYLCVSYGVAVVADWIILSGEWDESENDPTIRRVCGFAESWGYSQVLVVNAFEAIESRRP